jgi:hypothetical protein
MTTDERIEKLMKAQEKNYSAPRALKPLPVGDPTVIGRDSLGRINRTRNLTPEQREAKRVQIARVREARLARIREVQKSKPN